MENGNVIELKNIYKKFDLYVDKRQSFKEKFLFHPANNHTEVVVLDDISLSIKKGESVGLIGRNGCGKSTLLKLISRIMYPEKGTVAVEGRVSSLIELGAGFHPDMSGRENIFINASILGLSKKETEERMAQIIEFSELGDFIERPVRTYSSGMYSKLSFAVTAVLDTDIMLVDEVLSVGDEHFRQKSYKKMEELMRSDRTVLIVSHATNTLKEFCDQVLWINDGKFMKLGDTEEVLDEYDRFMKL